MAGGRDCGIHFFTDTPEALLPVLRQAVEGDRTYAAELEHHANLVERMIDLEASNHTAEQREQARQLLDDLRRHIAQPPQGPDGEAMAHILLRPGLVSLYWYDHIRVENLDKMTVYYATRVGPALGTGIYDGSNAVFSVSDGQARLGGLYWFDEDDVKPLNPTEAARLLGREALAFPLAQILRMARVDAMEATLKARLGLDMTGHPMTFKARGYPVVEAWQNGVVWYAR